MQIDCPSSQKAGRETEEEEEEVRRKEGRGEEEGREGRDLMFYSHQILARKGPLGVIWLAAHLDKKLRRQQVFQADIPDSVEAILYATEPRALRLSGQLLLGVARIYAKKVGYLYTDCNDAMLKLRQAYHVGATQVDLAPDAVAAPLGAITLPEHYLEDWEAFESAGGGGGGATASSAGGATARQTKRRRGNVNATTSVVDAEPALSEGFVPLEFNEDDEFNLFGGEQPTMEGLRSRFDDFDDDEPERLRGGGADSGGVALEPGSAMGLDEQMLMTPSREPVPPPAEDGLEDELLPMPPLDDAGELPMPEMGNDELATSLPPSADRSLPPVSPQQFGADELPNVTTPSMPPSSSKRKSPDAADAVRSESPDGTVPPSTRSRQERPRKKQMLQVDEYLVISKKDMRDALNDTSDIVVERRIPGRKRKAWQRSEDATKALALQPSVEPTSVEIKVLYERCFQFDGTKKQTITTESPVVADVEAHEVPEMEAPPGLEDDAFRFDDAMPEPEVPAMVDVEEEHLVPMATPGRELGTPPSERRSGEPSGAPPPLGLREALAIAPDDGPAHDDAQGQGVNTLSTRSRRVANFMKAEFVERRASGSRKKSTSIELNDVLKEGSTKAEAARMLLEMLTLTTKGFMNISQKKPYGSIVLEPTPEMLNTESF